MSDKDEAIRLVDDFLEHLILEKGIKDLDPETKKELIDDMRDRLMGQINAQMFEQLPEEKTSELLNKITDENSKVSGEDVTSYLEEAGVDSMQVMIDAMMKFKEFYLKSED